MGLNSPPQVAKATLSAFCSFPREGQRPLGSKQIKLRAGAQPKTLHQASDLDQAPLDRVHHLEGKGEVQAWAVAPDPRSQAWREGVSQSRGILALFFIR